MSEKFLTRDQFGIMRGEEFKYVVTSEEVSYVQYGGQHREILYKNKLDDKKISYAGTINSCCKDEGGYLHISYNGNNESLGLNVPTTDLLDFIYSQIEDTFYKRVHPDKEVIRYRDFAPVENTESETHQESNTEQAPKPETEKPKWNPFGGNH